MTIPTITAPASNPDSAALQAGFNGFRLSADRKAVVYGGLTADKQAIEIRQPVCDLDIMLVLIANVLQTALSSQLGDARHHRTDAVAVEPEEGGGLVLNLVSHEIVRSFHLSSATAGRLAADLATTLRRTRLRAVT